MIYKATCFDHLGAHHQALIVPNLLISHRYAVCKGTFLSETFHLKSVRLQIHGLTRNTVRLTVNIIPFHTPGV
jgi:hypothetical protein